MLRHIVCIGLAIVVARSAPGQEARQMVSVAPTPPRAVVINPGNGCVLYGSLAGHDERLLAADSGRNHAGWSRLTGIGRSGCAAGVVSGSSGWQSSVLDTRWSGA